jgi:glycosyltransferase involved in cell wall biosynthesis
MENAQGFRMMPLRVALNAWSLMSQQAGIAAYTRNLAAALLESDAVNVRLFYGYGWSTELRTAPLAGIESVKSWVRKLVPRPYALLRFAQQQCFSVGLRQRNCDLYHEPGFLPFNFDGPTIVTIHDLSPLRYPEAHPPQRVREFNERLPRAIAKAAHIIVDAESVRAEVMQTFGVSADRIHAIHLGVAPHFHPRNAEETFAVRQHYQLEHGRYVLAVGTLEPRKNLIQAIDAYAGLPEAIRRTTPLVIAGMRGWLVSELETRLRQLEARGEVRWLGFVSNEALPSLYSGATMLVYPSLYEGFGLPVLEAMASGIPVVTSNRSSLPEVAGGVGVLVDPEDTEGLRSAMGRLIENKQEARRLGQLGIVRAGQFTWKDCAKKTIAIYQKAAQIRG